MHGNVCEWCLDEWHDSYEGAPTDDRAWVDDTEEEQSLETAKLRLLRGGSWDVDPRGCRSADRVKERSGGVSLNIGFRVACLPQGPLLNP